MHCRHKCPCGHLREHDDLRLPVNHHFVGYQQDYRIGISRDVRPEYCDYNNGRKDPLRCLDVFPSIGSERQGGIYQSLLYIGAFESGVGYRRNGCAASCVLGLPKIAISGGAGI